MIIKKVKKEDKITKCMICGSKDLRIEETNKVVTYICNKCGTKIIQKKEKWEID